MSNKNFSSVKNAFYIIYMIVTAFFLMNDYKVTTLVMMVILAPAILFMEHYENTQKSSGESEGH